MNKEELIKAWEAFANANNHFQLNPDAAHVQGVAEGCLANKEQHGLPLCPCRLRDGSRKRDMELICPCDFESQDTWKNEGRCWCGLFVKQ